MYIEIYYLKMDFTCKKLFSNNKRDILLGYFDKIDNLKEKK